MPIHSSRILYEDQHLLAVNKLSGELVVRGKGKVGKLPLLDVLKKNHPGLRAIHRLDFQTSGVVVFAKTKQAEKAIVESGFRGWKKTYRTLVAGRVQRAGGVIRIPLPARGRGTVPALSRYKLERRFANSSELLVTIETGRHHQIRLHLAGIGHPLILDPLYGKAGFNRLFTREFGMRTFFLHAEAISFPHPVTGKLIEIQAPPPAAFLGMLKKLNSI